MRPLDPNPFQGLNRNTSVKRRNVSSELQSRSISRRKVKEKDNILGFEVHRCLQWQNWELGKEYTKHLLLKNVRLKTQKMKFSPPATTFFRTLFPQMVTLSAGTSFTLPITFRPLEKRDHEDSITFETDDGIFSVSLQAALPRHTLTFPEELTLPMCAVFNSSEAMFILQSTCDLQMQFRWDVPEPFLIIPQSGELDPRCQICTKVLFQPQIALVHSVVATCHFGLNEEYTRSIQLTAISKYPHLLVSVPGETCEDTLEVGPVLQFGSVGVDMVSEKNIEICNPSVVDAAFHIEQEKRPGQVDCHFSCGVSGGIVPAQGKLRVPLKFSPRTVGIESVDYFQVIPAGNITKSVVKVSGICKGPNVSLHTSVLNFGLVNLGEEILRTLEMTNSSDVPALFQFDINTSESVFSFDRTYGTLGPGETRSVKITFSPIHPIPHNRRVTCLLHHQDPLFVDLIGSCHSDMDKPAVVLPKHMSLYRTNMARGLTIYPPDILDAMIEEKKINTDTEGALVLQEQIDATPEKHHLQDTASEYFNDDFNQEDSTLLSHITANTRDFDFGQCVGHTKETLPESLPLSLTNHTKGKVTVMWTCKPHSPFRVTPEVTDIPPLKSTSFRVVFQPSQMNTLYEAELEGFIFYKVLRDYRNVKDATVCPPWCITLRTRGHTFQLGQGHFVPSCVLDSPHMVFPPVRQDMHTYRSLLLQNTGSTIMTYAIDQMSCLNVQVKPASGHLAPGSHQILLVRTSPHETGLTRNTLPLQLNYSSDFSQDIVLFCRAETPQLCLEKKGRLYFKPTYVGTQSECSYSLKNCCRVPLHFEWTIQQTDRSYFSVSPCKGIIRPNETLSQTWSFVPQEEKNYFIKATVLSWPADEASEPVSKRHYPLRITGEGCRGTLSTQQELLDLGNILVGSFQSHDLLLSNDGNCSLEYTLSAKQEIMGACDPDEVINDPIALEFDHTKGRLPARTKLKVRIIGHPARRLPYTWTISYCILSPKALDPANQVTEEQFLCSVTAQGVYPMFTVVDACPTGSASALTKTQLWRLFSLERLNSCLQSDPTPQELKYRVPTRHSTRRCPPVNTPVLLDFNFGAAPVGSEPFVALLLLENNGVLPVNWDFLYPVDQQIELEFWAETWEFDPSEIHQMRIQDNKLFIVSPKSGVLRPGQQQTIQLSYRHDFVGTDRLPVLLKLSHGREILLNFIGVTVEKEQRYVHFTSTKHQFTPVAIGSSSPPIQIYELYNGGSVAVIYEIQLEPLRGVQEQNYHHPIFQCLNPRGEILPGATAYVEWIFSPVEAKTYSVTAPVHILGGDSALITFEGIGYEQSILGDTIHSQSSHVIINQPHSYWNLPQVPRLTQQKLAFGDVPVFCKSSRVLFLNNTSESEALLFTWYAGSPNASEVLQVSPLLGTMKPGESVSVVVTFQCGEQASFYALELVCEIFMEKALAEYERAVREWEEEEERQTVEFTINEPAEKKFQTSCLRSGGPGRGQDRHQLTEIKRYKTLPPIKNGDYTRPPVSRDRESRQAQKEGKKLRVRPEPPLPIQLHLSVTGRSHHPPDFLNQFPNDFQRHFQQHKLPKKKMEKAIPVDLQPETGEPDGHPGKPTKAMQEMATDIMAAVIRNLLDDKQFHEALEEIQNDPVPYFRQFRSQEISPETTNIPLAEELSSEQTPSGAMTEETEEEVDKSATSQLITAPEHRKSEAEQTGLGQEELKETFKRAPLFSQLVESILENTLQNIMIEANRGEVVLTTRPRVIALPPATPRGITPTSLFRTPSVAHNVPATSMSPEDPGPTPPTDIQ
ncbi:PREDICTED: coiled-coil domain-containing protein 108 [Nanorana parkeri]|uniref:coiled-coil domain-containing protein 108 n=1 Tax=Nanorana parkeri TaxID=125878 RepID=UPI00085438B3|nr:PREDICTED: coiled-coil domain-containing protein 108 [Nanorana parkeri]